MTKFVLKTVAALTVAAGALAATAPAEAHGYGYRSYGYTSYYVPRCHIVYRSFYDGYTYVSRPVRVCH